MHMYVFSNEHNNKQAHKSAKKEKREQIATSIQVLKHTRKFKGYPVNILVIHIGTSFQKHLNYVFMLKVIF